MVPWALTWCSEAEAAAAKSATATLDVDDDVRPLRRRVLVDDEAIVGMDGY